MNSFFKTSVKSKLKFCVSKLGKYNVLLFIKNKYCNNLSSNISKILNTHIFILTVLFKQSSSEIGLVIIL